MSILFDARRVGGAEDYRTSAELAGRDIGFDIDGGGNGNGDRVGIGEGEGESRGQEEEGEAGHFGFLWQVDKW